MFGLLLPLFVFGTIAAVAVKLKSSVRQTWASVAERTALELAAGRAFDDPRSRNGSA